jgi:hypothetical protein
MKKRHSPTLSNVSFLLGSKIISYQRNTQAPSREKRAREREREKLVFFTHNLNGTVKITYLPIY